MRLLIYGGRDFVPSMDSAEFLDDLRTRLQESDVWNITVVSGGARGADSYGEFWATFWDYPVDKFPADWGTHGKAAGFIRNQQMLDSGIDLAIQFPGGKGTADMRSRLDKAGVRVIEYKED